MKNTNNTNLSFSASILLIFLFIVVMSIVLKDFIFPFIAPESLVVTDSQKVSSEIATALTKIDSISLNTSILKSSYLQNLIPLQNFPIDATTLSNFGKFNPFVGNFSVVSETASSTVGGVIFSNQRSASPNSPIVPVVNNRPVIDGGR